MVQTPLSPAEFLFGTKGNPPGLINRVDPVAYAFVRGNPKELVLKNEGETIHILAANEPATINLASRIKGYTRQITEEGEQYLFLPIHGEHNSLRSFTGTSRYLGMNRDERKVFDASLTKNEQNYLFLNDVQVLALRRLGERTELYQYVSSQGEIVTSLAHVFIDKEEDEWGNIKTMETLDSILPSERDLTILLAPADKRLPGIIARQDWEKQPSALYLKDYLKQ